MASDDRSSAREILLVHLERLYAFARLLTPSADAANELVVATAENAPSPPDDVRSATAGRAWALKRLLATYRADPMGGELAWPEPREGLPPGPPEAPSVDQPLQSHRESLAQDTVAARLPAVFATLRTGERVLLFLSDAEGFNTETIASILAHDVPSTEARIRHARRALLEGLRADLRPSEQALIRAYIPEGALSDALQSHVHSLFTPLPGGLRHSVVSATSSPTRAAKSAPMPTASGRAASRASDANKKDARKGSGLLTRALIGVVLVALVGTAGYLAAQWIDRGPETNLILLAADHAADRPSPTLSTSRLDEAERFVQEELNLRTILPSIDQASLDGVMLTELVSGVTVPAFVYAQDDTEPVTLYALSYRLLDQYSGRVELSMDVLRQIEDDTHFDLHDLGHAQVLVWRHRDIIFIAVTEGNASDLRDRILMPS